MADAEIPTHVPGHLVADIDYYQPGPADQDVFAAWHELSKRLQPDSAPAPLLYTPRNGGHWIVTTGQALEDLFPDDKNLSNRSVTIPAREGMRFRPGEADGEDHAALRGAITRAFTPKFVKDLRQPIRDVIEELISAIKPKGSCDFMAEFASILPVRLFLGMMNLPLKDGAMLQDLTYKLFQSLEAEEKGAALDELYSYLGGYVTARYDGAGTDLISTMSRADSSGARLSRDDVHAIAVNLLLGGLDTVAAMLGFILRHLVENPDLRKSLVADPGLIERTSGELIRRFPLAVTGRVVISDFTYNGILLKAGDQVALPTQLHGLDGHKFADPLKVDLDRRIPVNMTFGRGRHLCVGNVIARVELVEALTAWLRHIPDFAIQADANIEIRGGTVTSLSCLPLEWEVA